MYPYLSVMFRITIHIVVSKIDDNRCKHVQKTGEFTLILGVQIVLVYSYIEPTTDYCICSE